MPRSKVLSAGAGRVRLGLVLGGVALLLVGGGAVLRARMVGPKDPHLAHELAGMAARDAGARREEIRVGAFRALGRRQVLTAEQQAAIARLQEVDTTNQRLLADTIAANGWPGRALVGNNGAHDAWLVVQHAPIEMQDKALALMQRQLSDVSAADFAFLTDRVRVHHGQPQVYGTQYLCRDGKNVMEAVDDPARLEERRRSVGLSTVADNEKRLAQLYGPC